ncbi:zinc ribbon domain-containing protein [Mediterraneibacter glycyrrhizinilyticus]|uniref:zinc ribbon domain-containing protein n=1 Tax=Mediterraneibacter glycyrrhizinilyticus TaxID=342942 RepID=UPI0019608D37|nr:zinc ribbon domain-containing protein [Mediterraneibacter glycyrrhizinilyticus]MBM6751414.1 zinc ribbon domain-containing protein [Mediterraneibacter glycyrrhizinilyticus]
MKDFFEDLGKRLGETAETMTSKAGDAIEIQKLKSQVRSLARGNAVDLMELGKTIYDRFKAGEEVEESAKGLCEAIQNREASMENYEKKIARIKGASECGNCGKMVARDMSFCPYCGEKIDAAVYDADETEAEFEEGDYVDIVREKAASAAETVAEKADEAAQKAGDMAEKAAQKTGDMADKAAQKFGEAAGKAADKLSEAAEKIKNTPDDAEQEK